MTMGNKLMASPPHIKGVGAGGMVVEWNAEGRGGGGGGGGGRTVRFDPLASLTCETEDPTPLYQLAAGTE